VQQHILVGRESLHLTLHQFSSTCRCAKVAPAGHALRKHWARLAKAICFYARSAKSFDFLTWGSPDLLKITASHKTWTRWAHVPVAPVRLQNRMLLLPLRVDRHQLHLARTAKRWRKTVPALWTVLNAMKLLTVQVLNVIYV